MDEAIDVGARACHRLRYAQPGANFNEALPIGNGRLGGMVRGATGDDVLCVNDDRFWAGGDPPPPVPEGPLVLAEIRRRLLAGDVGGAEALVEQKLLGAFNQPYLPAADVHIAWDHADVSDYARGLDLATGLADVAYTTPTTGRVRRTCFSSAADQVLVLQAAFARPGDARTVLRLASKARSVSTACPSGLALVADAPTVVDWPGVDDRVRYGENIFYDAVPPRRCCTMLHVLDAPVTLEGDALVVDGSFTLLVTTAVSDAVPDIEAACRDRLDAAAAQGHAELLRRHVTDHARLYGRAALHLDGPPGLAAVPTDVRLARVAAGAPDPGLDALLFNYGRYLMLAASRPGCQAINLQGIWNDRVQPPWWSNYTLNINLQMNYWPAEVCNLAECHEPLFGLIAELGEAGVGTARVQYGMRGWVVHHQTDYRRQTTLVGGLNGRTHDFPIKYAMWTLAGAWLCQHLWQHYLFGGDRAFLRDTAWPILRSAADFYLDWLVDLPDGSLSTAPSTSPENSYRLPDGSRHALCVGSTMDLALLREFFSTIVAAGRALGLSGERVVEDAAAALARLPGPRIAADGQVMEWGEDWPQAEAPHRHVSHLYGVFPGAEISPGATPDLAAASAKVLAARGETGTGWSFAWKAAIWARLGDGAMAHANIAHLLHPVPSHVEREADLGGGIYPNLLTACPPFNIDANLGVTAAIAEMLLQSQGDEVVLLPALPGTWSEGAFKGLRCRGRLEVDATWSGGRLREIRVRSAIPQVRIFRYGKAARRVRLAEAGETRIMLRQDGQPWQVGSARPDFRDG